MTHYKKVFGLTGGIATGKSTVSNILKNWGYDVVDMDKISREIFQPGQRAYNKVVETFGQDILDAQGEIDRKKLASIVFSSSEKLEILNNISHPEIMMESKWKIDRILETKDLVFVDSPLLFETIETMGKYDLYFDKLILVYAPRDIQLDRLIKRDGISLDQAGNILNSQMNIEEKREKSDYIIDNTGDLEMLKVEVKKLVRSL